jgi:hypothetical protein
MIAAKTTGLVNVRGSFSQIGFLRGMLRLSLLCFPNIPRRYSVTMSYFGLVNISADNSMHRCLHRRLRHRWDFLRPITALASGLVIAMGNRLSAGLQPQFILISGAAPAQALLNVPLTAMLLTRVPACCLFFGVHHAARRIRRCREQADGALRLSS